MIKVVWLICMIFLLWSSSVIAGRNDVLVFKYSSFADTPEEAKSVDLILNQFVSIITDKLRRISYQSNLSDPLRARLESLNIRRVNGEVEEDNNVWIVNDLNLNQMFQLWDDEHALSMMHGRVVEDAEYRIAKSSFFLGGYDTPLSGSFDIQLKIIDAEYEITRDSHSAMVMYSLLLSELGLIAPQGELNCDNSELARELLKITHTAAQDSSRSNPQFARVIEHLNMIHSQMGEQC